MGIGQSKVTRVKEVGEDRSMEDDSSDVRGRSHGKQGGVIPKTLVVSDLVTHWGNAEVKRGMTCWNTTIKTVEGKKIR